jgi:hypothetical protein
MADRLSAQPARGRVDGPGQGAVGVVAAVEAVGAGQRALRGRDRDVDSGRVVARGVALHGRRIRVAVHEARGRAQLAQRHGVVDPLRTQRSARRPVAHVQPPLQHVVVVGQGQPPRVGARHQLVAVVVDGGGGPRVRVGGRDLATPQVVRVAPVVAHRVRHRAQLAFAVEGVPGRVVGATRARARSPLRPSPPHAKFWSGEDRCDSATAVAPPAGSIQPIHICPVARSGGLAICEFLESPPSRDD